MRLSVSIGIATRRVDETAASLLERQTGGREWWGSGLSLAGIFVASLKGRVRLPETS